MTLFNPFHGNLYGGEAIVLAILLIGRKTTMFGAVHDQLLAFDGPAQDFDSFMGIPLLALGIYSVQSANDAVFMRRLTILRGIFAVIYTPLIMLLTDILPQNSWLLVVVETVQILATVYSLSRIDFEAPTTDPNLSSLHGAVPAVYIFGTGALMLIGRAGLLTQVFDTLVFDRIAAIPNLTPFLADNESVVRAGYLSAQPCAILGLVYFWNAQNKRFLAHTVMGRLLAAAMMVYAVFSSEHLPQSMLAFALLDSTGAILTWNRLKASGKPKAE